MKRVVHQAFWDVLEADLSAEPPQYEYAIRLFEEIREASWCCSISALIPGVCVMDTVDG